MVAVNEKFSAGSPQNLPTVAGLVQSPKSVIANPTTVNPHPATVNPQPATSGESNPAWGNQGSDRLGPGGTDDQWFDDDNLQSSYGGNSIIYCGYRYDPETENYYVRNRFYAPVLGRWLQRDPIGYAGDAGANSISAGITGIGDVHGITH